MYQFVAARYKKSQISIYGWYHKICGSIDRYHDRHLVWFIQLIDYTDIEQILDIHSPSLLYIADIIWNWNTCNKFIVLSHTWLFNDWRFVKHHTLWSAKKLKTNGLDRWTYTFMICAFKEVVLIWYDNRKSGYTLYNLCCICVANISHMYTWLNIVWFVLYLCNSYQSHRKPAYKLYNLGCICIIYSSHK